MTIKNPRGYTAQNPMKRIYPWWRVATYMVHVVGMIKKNTELGRVALVELPFSHWILIVGSALHEILGASKFEKSKTNSQSLGLVWDNLYWPNHYTNQDRVSGIIIDPYFTRSGFDIWMWSVLAITGYQLLGFPQLLNSEIWYLISEGNLLNLSVNYNPRIWRITFSHKNGLLPINWIELSIKFYFKLNSNFFRYIRNKFQTRISRVGKIE